MPVPNATYKWQNGKEKKTKQNQKKVQIKLTRLSRQHVKFPFNLLCPVAHSLFGNYLAELLTLLHGTLIAGFLLKHLASHELLTGEKKPVASSKLQPALQLSPPLPHHNTRSSSAMDFLPSFLNYLHFFLKICQIHQAD